jgi:hypothetical protein
VPNHYNAVFAFFQGRVKKIRLLGAHYNGKAVNVINPSAWIKIKATPKGRFNF